MEYHHFTSKTESIENPKHIKSFSMAPYIKRGAITWIYSSMQVLLEELGIALASANSTGQHLFRNNDVIKTTAKRPTVYIHKYILTEKHAQYMGGVINSYINPSEPNTKYNGHVPFAMIQAAMFEFDLGFWKNKSSKEVLKAIDSYDIVIIDDFERIFGNKNMTIIEVGNLLKKLSKDGKSVIILETLPANQNKLPKHDAKLKIADEVIELTRSNGNGFKWRSVKHSNVPSIEFDLQIYHVDIEFLPGVRTEYELPEDFKIDRTKEIYPS